MSLLAPLFLLGGLAIAAPILLHLIRRTTRERLPMSSLMFLQPSPPRVTRRSRIENWFLLLLRCLVIGLLALAFSRPFWEQPLTATPSSESQVRHLLAVDTSASLRRDTLWEQSLSLLEEELNRIPREEAAAVFAFDRTWRTVMDFDTWRNLPASERAGMVLGNLREEQPGWAGTHLGQALLSAMEEFEELEKNDANPGPKRMVIFTDLQEGSHLEGLQGYDWPQDLEVDFRTVKSRKPSNAGARVLSARQPASHKDASAQTPPLRLVNASDSIMEQFQVHWADPQTGRPLSESLEVYVPAGQSRIVHAPALTASNRPPQLKLVLQGDEHGYDNTDYYLPPQSDTVPVLYLGPRTPEDTGSALYYLRLAFREWPGHNIILRYPEDPDSGSASLAIASGALPEARLEMARNHLQAGNTLWWIVDSTADGAGLARVLGADSLDLQEEDVDRYAMLGRIDFTHPLFLPFADPRYSDFTKIHFWNHRRLATNNLPQLRVIAGFDNGAPALLEGPVQGGRLMVLTSSWKPSDSQLALSSKFVPLLYSLLEMSGAISDRQTAYVVGDALPLRFSENGGTRAATASLRKPDGTETNVTDAASFSNTDQPGIYTLTHDSSSDGSLETRQWVVRVDAEESRTGPLPLDRLETLGVPLSQEWIAGTAMSEVRERQLRAADLESQQKIWRWLLLVALVLLLAEIWLAGRLSRQPVAEPA